MALLRDRFASPIGDILLVHDGDGRLLALDFADFEPRMRQLLRLQHGSAATTAGAAPASITAPLHAYFAGEAAELGGIPLATGGTPFQRSVWAALRMIPPGTTTTYGALARCIGRPTAFRAVGLANGANPVAIVVPCHRVIGADGTLTGFGGGLHRKRWLLEHEGVRLADPELSLSAVAAPAVRRSPGPPRRAGSPPRCGP